MSEAKLLAVVVMAGGKGVRMKSELPKALAMFKGRPMLSSVLDTARALTPDKIVVIVGHKREVVIEAVKATDVVFAAQEPQLGTAHAVAQAREALAGFKGSVAVLSADVPAITVDTLRKLINLRETENAAISVLTCVLDNPASYGRIIREGSRVVANVEAKDATPEQLKINEINSGVYVFDAGFLFESITKVGNENAQKEYYLTDLIAMAVNAGLKVSALIAENPAETLGVNTLEDLQKLESAAGR
ncbi:MAG: NTP transferase domain-containing protein [Nitrospinae bacterium]|nr:NTP transferase domain-containing protein [Nitrospinota bacterium]